MYKEQTNSLIMLIKRSKEIGNGWRECSEICWSLLLDEEDSEENLFELDHCKKRVRLHSDKPSLNNLMNQIYEWRERAITELRQYERMEKSKIYAKDLFK